MAKKKNVTYKYCPICGRKGNEYIYFKGIFRKQIRVNNCIWCNKKFVIKEMKK